MERQRAVPPDDSDGMNDLDTPAASSAQDAGDYSHWAGRKASERGHGDTHQAGVVKSIRDTRTRFPIGTGVRSQTRERGRMNTVEEAEALLLRMTRGEKAQLLQRVARDLGDAYPGIDLLPGVCGGEPVIVRTRIPVWALDQARRLGASDADLLHAYPALRAEDLANAWAYARAHRAQIDDQIREHEAA